MKYLMPAFLYKYGSVNQFLYEMLIRKQIWFSNPNDFNDPFDCDIPWSELYSQQESKYNVWVDGGYNKDEVSKLKFWQYEKYINDIRSFKNREYIYCLSANEDNLIMWAHYGSNHCGVRLKFDAYRMQKAGFKFKKVIYSNSLKPLNVDQEPLRHYKHLRLRKSTDWKMEREYRLFSNKPGYTDFPIECLVAIKFGLRCPEEHEKTITSLCEQLAYNHIKFHRSVASKNDYSLRTSFFVTNFKFYANGKSIE